MNIQKLWELYFLRENGIQRLLYRIQREKNEARDHRSKKIKYYLYLYVERMQGLK